MAGPDPEVLRGLVCSLTDSVMALAPRGWLELELTLASSPRGLRLAEVKAQGGGSSPKPLPELGLARELEAERLSQGCEELSLLLAQAGRRFEGGRVRLRRGAGALDWVFEDPAGAQVYFTRLDQPTVESLLVTDSLFDAVGGTERAFAALQSALERRLGAHGDHRFDPGAATATLTREGAPPELVPAQLVGSYDPDTYVWQWSWADPAVPGPACEAVRRVCAPEARQPGLSAFWRERFHCDEAFAWALAGHVAVAIGARGLVRVEREGQGAAMVLAPLRDVSPGGFEPPSPP